MSFNNFNKNKMILSNQFKGDFKDEKGEYKLFQIHEKTEPCYCHPETCGCWHYNSSFHEKRYLNGTKEIIKHDDDYIKRY